MHIKRLATLCLCLLVGTATVVTGTYAYFNSTQSSTSNTFSVGTLKMTSYRDDIPIYGPMFYTHDSVDGAMGTGYWQPGDAHTRGIIIQNAGSMKAKFSRLYATPEAEYGTSPYYDAMEFADQALVTIGVFEWKNGKIDRKAYLAHLRQYSNYFTERFEKTRNNKRRAEDQGITLEELKLADMEALAAAREETLNQTFTSQNEDGEDVNFTVREVYYGFLNELVNPGHDVPPELQYVLNPQETMHLGYTIILENLTPHKNNLIQGKEVKFSFSHEFTPYKP